MENEYVDLLDNLVNSKLTNRKKELCCFSAQEGKDYDNNLMFVGRAVNDWGNVFDLDSIDVSKFVNDMFKTISDDDSCPLKWVESSWGGSNDYNTKKSAFWRVIRNISLELSEPSLNDSWASKLIWSNLYKIAPSGGGNPSDSLCDAQFLACNQILKAEILRLKPKHIVFLTGLNWFDGFLADLINISEDNKSNLVEATGILRVNEMRIKVVIAKHPQCKPEAKFVNDVTMALKSF